MALGAADERIAVIVDLEGPDAVDLALTLGARGFRPILAINATSARREVIDMRPVLELLREGARFASSFPSGPDVLPVFILDSRRDSPSRRAAPGRFDNRWTVFPSDLPSVEQLAAANIDVVLIVQVGEEPSEDVEAIARKYQRGGLEVHVADVEERKTSVLSQRRSGWLSFRWRQLRRRFALRRQWDGSYGHRVPFPPEPSHG